MALIETRASRHTQSFWGPSTSIMTRLALWRSRRALTRLDARQLEDIGITVADAQKEARLALWDVPANWPKK